jgi:rhodanese-related sulfurtransferase
MQANRLLSTSEGMRQFTATQLKAYLEQTAEPPLLLDVREPWEFDVCRIAGSRLVPMRQIPEAAPAMDTDAETVVICHHGVRSFQVARFLEAEFGFTNLINLAGGVSAWARDVDPQMPVY